MPKNILIVEGHPDPAPERFNHALAEAYAGAAAAAGHKVSRLAVAALDLPYLRSNGEWSTPTTRPDILKAQDDVRAAAHLVFFYPLWLGDMPAMMKSFLEHLCSGGFAMNIDTDGTWHPRLTGKSARVVVTMGMPAVAYRLFYFSHSLKSFERNILRFAGVKPVASSLIGSVEGRNSAGHRASWLKTMQDMGREAR